MGCYPAVFTRSTSIAKCDFGDGVQDLANRHDSQGREMDGEFWLELAEKFKAVELNEGLYRLPERIAGYKAG